MRLFSVGLLFFLLSSSLFALTPFNLNGVKKLSVHVADYSEMFDKKMKPKLEAMMRKKLKKLKIDTDGYFHESLILLMQSQLVGKIKLLNLDLMVAGDVRPTGKTELTYGITYLLKDSVEIEDKEADLIESLEFLLDEFAEQYIQDNEE